MKRLFFFCLIASIIGCSSAPQIESENNLIGHWQNMKQLNAGVEFDENGSYYIISDNKRLEVQNPTAFQYTFDSKIKSDRNFTLTETNSGLKYEGKLIFLDKDNIQLSLSFNNAPSQDSYFARVMDL